ncbi:hypothetical protein GOBAR_AA35245 [Gossypium barbadense]|uniref:Uncharacterized protein n=1 Tax=Gossypium barbadense TaxID=3634 RepID=A0A2P5W2Y1_GOSBA|nr:hypothetical protein GOBAR_AA35245 [Gossypium barbadense]
MEREGIDSQGRGRVMVPTMLVGLRGSGDNRASGFQVTKNRPMVFKAKQRAKGKGVMVGTGPNSGLSLLRSNNGRFGMKANNGQGVFDDGSKLEPMGVADRRKNILIQPMNVSLNLNKEKHTAVCIMEEKNWFRYR